MRTDRATGISASAPTAMSALMMGLSSPTIHEALLHSAVVAMRLMEVIEVRRLVRCSSAAYLVPHYYQD